MDPLRPLCDPLPRGVERVAVAGLGAGLTLSEADGLATRDIDSGEQSERRGLREVVHDVLR